MILLLLAACGKTPPAEKPATRPSILLVTLDTTRADAVGPGQHNVDTPSYNALAARARRFRYAYCGVPQTLASHTTMLTGLYPAGHGVHENGRYLSDKTPLVTEQLKTAGYRTAAFVSAFAVAKRFGLGRGFDVYDDDFGAGAERRAAATTDRALQYLRRPAEAGRPLFMWVHYYDPHFPYDPPEPYRTRYANQPYFGEIAYMDEQLGVLVSEFEKLVPAPRAIIVVADHGEGLGDHGEQQHGDLLYQSTVRVPLLLIGPGITPDTTDVPVSTRHVYNTILDLAGMDAANSLRRSNQEVVMGEAMKPFLDYGWQPQVMAVDGQQKTILAGRTEVYDVGADPGETHDLAKTASISRAARAALNEYPIVPPEAAELPPNATDEDRRKLASLGYVSSGVRPVVRPDAPRPAEMTDLFPILDRSARLFDQRQYALVIPLLGQILAKDARNLNATLQLAVAYAELGREREAIEAFGRAQSIAPQSTDVKTYLALHYAHGPQWQRAAPLLEEVLAKEPHRLPAMEALALVRLKEGRLAAAADLWEQIYTMRTASAAEYVQLGKLEMDLGRTTAAIHSFETARAMAGAQFHDDLALGVLYLAAHRLDEARASLDRVPSSSPEYPMALFKRAQVSVLLREPDAPARIEAARAHEDATTRVLIDRERLFR